jgi:uncharacterized protein (DUF1330 family)
VSAHVVAELAIQDRKRYDRYAAALMSMLKLFVGRRLGADETAQVLEGA